MTYNEFVAELDALVSRASETGLDDRSMVAALDSAIDAIRRYPQRPKARMTRTED